MHRRVWMSEIAGHAVVTFFRHRGGHSGDGIAPSTKEGQRAQVLGEGVARTPFMSQEGVTATGRETSLVPRPWFPQLRVVYITATWKEGLEECSHPVVLRGRSINT